MFDPLTLVIGGAGILAWREFNKKDYGVLTPSRDERYRNAMEHCHVPEQLMQEAKLFYEHGLKAQAAMLKRRAEWRGRPEAVKKAHEEVYQKALQSKNIAAILDVAASFENWTATKKAATLRQRVTELQEQALVEAAQRAEAAAKEESKADEPKPAETTETATAQSEVRHTNGSNGIPRNTEAFTGVLPVAAGDT